MSRLTGRLTKSIRTKLKIGQEVLYSGTFYTARDQVHKKLVDLIKNRKRLPIDLKDAIIYYCGPTPSRFSAKGGSASGGKERIGSAGPTTSSRMDKFTPTLLKAGLGAMVGKGERSKEVVDSMKKAKAVYFLTFAGAGAYLSKRIKKARIVAYKELGPEAIYELKVENFPLIVGIDAKGRNIYKGKESLAAGVNTGDFPRNLALNSGCSG